MTSPNRCGTTHFSSNMKRLSPNTKLFFSIVFSQCYLDYKPKDLGASEPEGKD